MRGLGASGVAGRMDELQKEQNGRGAEKERAIWPIWRRLLTVRASLLTAWTSPWFAKITDCFSPQNISRPGGRVLCQLSTIQLDPWITLLSLDYSWSQLPQCQINLGAKQAVAVVLQFCIWQWYILSTTLPVRIEKSSRQFFRWSAKNYSSRILLQLLLWQCLTNMPCLAMIGLNIHEIYIGYVQWHDLVCHV